MPAVITGIGDVIQTLRDIPDSSGVRDALEGAASEFQSRLSSATPVGYSGRLQKSVVSVQDGDQFLVGYEEGVETAGNPDLDSVLKPRTRGKSVLWVPAATLGEILEAEVQSFQPEALSIMETEFLRSVS